MVAIGIILNFVDKVITIDSIVLPMQSINKLPTSNKKALGFNNSLERKMEPKSTKLANQRIVRIEPCCNSKKQPGAKGDMG